MKRGPLGIVPDGGPRLPRPPRPRTPPQFERELLALQVAVLDVAAEWHAYPRLSDRLLSIVRDSDHAAEAVRRRVRTRGAV